MVRRFRMTNLPFPPQNGQGLTAINGLAGTLAFGGMGSSGLGGHRGCLSMSLMGLLIGCHRSRPVGRASGGLESFGYWP